MTTTFVENTREHPIHLHLATGELGDVVKTVSIPGAHDVNDERVNGSAAVESEMLDKLRTDRGPRGKVINHYFEAGWLRRINHESPKGTRV